VSEQRRPVSIPSLWDTPEPVTRTPHTAASWIGAHVVRPLWMWRRELLILGVGVVVGLVPWAVRGAVWGAVPSVAVGAGCALAVVVGLVVLPGVRTWLWAGRIRRSWDAACRYSRVETVSARVPRVTRVEPHRAGERLILRLPRGASPTDLEAAAERIAVVMDVQKVTVRRDPRRMRTPAAHVIRRSPWSGRIVSPLADAPAWDLADGVPLGVDDLGAPVRTGLLGRNLLLGGEPEAGKSVALASVLAAACLDPSVRLYGLDGKMVELALWEPILSGLATTNTDDAISLLEELATEMNDRYEKLRADGKRVASRDMGWAPTLLAIDELRFFTANPDKKVREKINGLLIDLVARGRAAWIIVVAATQRPSADVIPTSLRDLMALRMALRCSTRDASDTVLGVGWATAGYSAATIAVEDRGVGLLLAEGGLPVLLKTPWLSDDAIGSIVSRARRLRGVAPMA
jgi:hypothetical protein